MQVLLSRVHILTPRTLVFLSVFLVLLSVYREVGLLFDRRRHVESDRPQRVGVRSSVGTRNWKTVANAFSSARRARATPVRPSKGNPDRDERQRYTRHERHARIRKGADPRACLELHEKEDGPCAVAGIVRQCRIEGTGPSDLRVERRTFNEDAHGFLCSSDERM